jgi:hypothetical protein
MYSDLLSYSVAAERLKAQREILKAELGAGNSELDPANAAARTEQATAAADAAAGGVGGPARRQAVVAAASAERQMKPVSQAAKLAAAETELACVKMVLANVKLDRDELRQERDDWRRDAETLCAEKLIAAKLKEAGERRVASPERRPLWRRLVG